MKWEYQQISIMLLPEDLDRPDVGIVDWRFYLEQGHKITGISNILNYFGEDGWEAISMNGIVFEPMPENNSSYETSGFMVVLKRPKVA